MAMLLGIVITVILAVVTYFVRRLKSMRKIDIYSMVLNLLAWTKLIHVLRQVQKLFPRSQAGRIATGPGGNKIQMPGFNTLHEVRSLKARDNDVYVVTYPKSGTTWSQEIVWLICTNADFAAAKRTRVQQRFPTVEMVHLPCFQRSGFQCLETWPSSNTRFIKTHLPYKLLPEETQFGKKGKIIYVARNPKDACVSFFHFHRAFRSLQDPGQFSDFLQKFCEGNVEFGDWFEHVLEYWQKHKEDERIYFLTYERLKKDLKKEIFNLCEFLGRELTEQQADGIVEHCSFKSMSENDKTNWNLEHRIGLDARISKFMRKGEVGDWKNYFTINQNAAFDAMYEQKMKNSDLVMDFDLDQ